MYIDLNVPVPLVTTTPQLQSKKGKSKQQRAQVQQPPVALFSPAQITAIESRLDVLEHRTSLHIFGLSFINLS